MLWNDLFAEFALTPQNLAPKIAAYSFANYVSAFKLLNSQIY